MVPNSCTYNFLHKKKTIVNYKITSQNRKTILAIYNTLNTPFLCMEFQTNFSLNIYKQTDLYHYIATQPIKSQNNKNKR